LLLLLRWWRGEGWIWMWTNVSIKLLFMRTWLFFRSPHAGFWKTVSSLASRNHTKNHYVISYTINQSSDRGKQPAGEDPYAVIHINNNNNNNIVLERRTMVTVTRDFYYYYCFFLWLSLFVNYIYTHRVYQLATMRWQTALLQYADHAQCAQGVLWSEFWSIPRR